MNRKSSIAPAALQAVLDASANASQKGQAQWHTPPEWGKVLSIPLPGFRPDICDLTCGNGKFLQSARLNNAGHLLGCEIEPVTNPVTNPPSTINHSIHRTTADVTTLFPLLKLVEFRCDLFALNPPWDCHWYRDKLQQGFDLSIPAVISAFEAHDGRTAQDTIDSTVATLCMALDLCSIYGEGFLIANEATLQRLLFAPDAPHRALTQHLWAHLVIEGNICDTSPRPSTLDSRPPFQTGVIYFARDHTSGIQQSTHPTIHPSIESVRRACDDLYNTRYTLREGATLQTYVSHEGDKCVELWKAAAQEHDRLADPVTRNYNIWLEHGVIKTALSVFDSKSGRIDEDAAKKLHDLNGQTPQRLVMKKETRRALQAALGNHSALRTPHSAIPWTVDPALAAAVEKAIARYEDERTPLVALNPIQRLGYLDEYDEITCTQDLGDASPPLSTINHPLSTLPLFSSGVSYSIRTTTVMVKRAGKKMNLHGDYDDVQWDGQELAIFIKDNLGTEHVFMEQRLMQPNVKVSIVAPAQRQAYRRLVMDEVNEAVTIEYTLQDLVAHFEIPAVPDVAQRYPDRYQDNLLKLAHIQQLAQQLAT